MSDGYIFTNYIIKIKIICSGRIHWIIRTHVRIIQRIRTHSFWVRILLGTNSPKDEISWYFHINCQLVCMKSKTNLQRQHRTTQFSVHSCSCDLKGETIRCLPITCRNDSYVCLRRANPWTIVNHTSLVALKKRLATFLLHLTAQSLFWVNNI